VWCLSAVRVRCFKSFGPDWTSLPIPCGPEQHLVAITGPNGSGKSSLLEAIQFACGAPATDLRARTLRALCNADHPDKLCEVEVCIQPRAAVPGGRAGGVNAAKAGRASANTAPGRRQPAGAGKGRATNQDSSGESMHKQHHWLRAALSADGSRVFQVDGRMRAAAQVKVCATLAGCTACALWVQASRLG
jgi:energy-coupling factor transporter ATP-binding protein EcfA2